MAKPNDIQSEFPLGRLGPDTVTPDDQSRQIIEKTTKDQVGNVRKKRYLKGRFLGKGGFAKCFEFVNAETMFVHAAKVIQKSSLTKSRAKQKLMSEIKIHRSIKHANVCHF